MLISKDVSLKYANSRGMDMTLTPLTGYFLVECKESMENNINSDDQGNLDGETFISQNLAPRHLVISGFLNTYDSGEIMKRRMERVFNMTLPGVLTYTNNTTGITRTLNCYVESFPSIRLDGRSLTYEIDLEALKPLWMGPGISGYISTIEKMGHFPLIIPTPDKFVFGYRLPQLQHVINNVGDVAAGVNFRITAMGEVENPSITHLDSGSTIKIFYTMQKDEYIDIYSLPDRADVIINGTENGMKYLTDETQRQFFTLPIGNNTLSYNADLNVANLEIFFDCTDLYLGV